MSASWTSDLRPELSSFILEMVHGEDIEKLHIVYWAAVIRHIERHPLRIWVWEVPVNLKPKTGPGDYIIPRRCRV